MKYLAVKNFEQFQHYHDRAPKWIKLYGSVLDDYAFTSLSDAARGQLILIWLLASRHANRVPNDAGFIARAIHSRRVDLKSLIAAGFLIECDDTADDPASKLLAKAEPVASTDGAEAERSAILEGEREGERYTESENKTELGRERVDAPRLALVTDQAPVVSPAAQEKPEPPRGVAHPAPGPSPQREEKRQLPASAKVMLRTAYRWTRGPGTDRQQSVLAQLIALMGDGVRYQGAMVRAVDAAHLEWACAQALGQVHRNPDATINTVLLKIRDTYTEVLAAREADQRAREVADASALHAAADAWLAQHPELAAEVDRLAEFEVPGNAEKSVVIAQARRAERTRLIDARREAMAGDPAAVAS